MRRRVFDKGFKALNILFEPMLIQGGERNDFFRSVPGDLFFLFPVFFDHHVKIAAAETECTDACPARMFFFGKPGSGLGVQVKGTFVNVQFGVRFMDFQGRWEHFVINSESSFHQTCGASRCLGVSDHRFHGPERTPSVVVVRLAEKTL